MAPCLRWWGSIRSPSRPLLAAFGKTYRSALGDEPQIPGRLPQPFCYPPSTLMPPNGSCRQLHATARHFERLADEVSVSPLKFKFEPPCRSSSSSNVGAFAAFHCDTKPGLGCSFWRLVDDCGSPFENGAHFRASQKLTLHPWRIRCVLFGHGEVCSQVIHRRVHSQHLSQNGSSLGSVEGRCAHATALVHHCNRANAPRKRHREGLQYRRSHPGWRRTRKPSHHKISTSNNDRRESVASAASVGLLADGLFHPARSEPAGHHAVPEDAPKV
jgi:hypothetical protein